jgi:hypothetical protein
MSVAFVVMIPVRLIVFTLGLSLVVMTARSAIRQFVMPRSAPDGLTRNAFLFMRFLFELRLHKDATYEDRDRVMALYAPVALLFLPVVWLSLVLTGYAGMYWAVGVRPIIDAVRISGSSLLTLGFAVAEGVPTTALEFTEAAIGLILVALLISYLPTMYAAFSRREAVVNMLEVRAGSPPSPVELYARYHRLGRMDELTAMWATWEQWFVDIEETHTSLAALSFFRSPQPERSWITAAGAILDSGALYASALDFPRNPQTELCLRAGYLALQHIADFFGIPYNPKPAGDEPISITRLEFDEVCDRLLASGVPLKADRDQAWQDFRGWRVNYDLVLLTLATLTMAPYAMWSSDRSLPRRRRHFIGKSLRKKGSVMG